VPNCLDGDAKLGRAVQEWTRRRLLSFRLPGNAGRSIEHMLHGHALGTAGTMNVNDVMQLDDLLMAMQAHVRQARQAEIEADRAVFELRRSLGVRPKPTRRVRAP
jgi:hypothetical protein